MSLTKVYSGRVVHAQALKNEIFHLAWGNITPITHPDPWAMGETPPPGNSKALNEVVVKGVADGTDVLKNNTVLTQPDGVVEVYQGGTVYLETTDFIVQAGGIIDWSPAQAQPTTGSDYNVKYRYSTDKITELENELGRREANQVEFCVEDQYGDIEANGSRWSIVTQAEAEQTQIVCPSNVQTPGVLDLDSRLLITMNPGYINNIIVMIVDSGGVSGDVATVAFDAPTNTLTVDIESGVTTEATMVTEIATDSHVNTAVADNPTSTWTIGAGLDAGTVIGGTGLAGGEYLLFDTTENQYYIWFDIGNASVDPAIVDRIGVEIDIENADSENVVAGKLQAVLDALTDMTATVNDDVVLTVNSVPAEVPDAENVNAFCDVTTVQQGTEFPTPYLYLQFKFDSADASSADIYQVGIYINTVPVVSVPSYIKYLTPDLVLDKGIMYLNEFVEPFPRSPGRRETVEFVLGY